MPVNGCATQDNSVKSGCCKGDDMSVSKGTQNGMRPYPASDAAPCDRHRAKKMIDAIAHQNIRTGDEVSLPIPKGITVEPTGNEPLTTKYDLTVQRVLDALDGQTYAAVRVTNRPAPIVIDVDYETQSRWITIRG